MRRKRVILTMAATVLAYLITIVTTTWCICHVESTEYRMAVKDGAIIIGWMSAQRVSPGIGTSFRRVEEIDVSVWPRAVSHAALKSVYNEIVEIPLWPFALCVLILGLWRLRRDPRLCRYCGYDLRGSGSGNTCPECGQGYKANSVD